MKNSKIGNQFFVKSYLQNIIMQSLYSGRKKSVLEVYHFALDNYNFLLKWAVPAQEFMFVLKELQILGYIDVIDLKNDISLLNMQDANCKITASGFEAYKNQIFQNQAANIFNSWRSFNLSVLIVVLSVLALLISIIALFTNS